MQLPPVAGTQFVGICNRKLRFKSRSFTSSNRCASKAKWTDIFCLPSSLFAAANHDSCDNASCRRPRSPPCEGIADAVANGEDDLLLGVNVSGCSTAHQRDRDLVLRDGDAFFATRDESGFTVTRLTPVRFVGCRVPREAVAPLVGRIDDTPLRLVPPRSEALTLVVTYARDCRRSRSRNTPNGPEEVDSRQ
jgi:hypothetical protein